MTYEHSKERKSEPPGQVALACHQQQTGMVLSSDCQQVETFSKSPEEHSTKDEMLHLCASCAFSECTPHSKFKQLHTHGYESDPQLASFLLPCKMKKNTHHKSPEQSPSNQPMNHQQIIYHSWKRTAQRLAPSPVISIAPLLGMREEVKSVKYLTSYLTSCTAHKTSIKTLTKKYPTFNQLAQKPAPSLYLISKIISNAG